MPWNGCKFEGDPESPAEIFSKAQYTNADENEYLGEDEPSWFDGKVGVFQGGRLKTTKDVLGACNAVVGQEDEYPCAVVIPAWDGGLAQLTEMDNDAEVFADFLNAGGITFDIIGKVANFGSIAVKQFALNDYQKDMSGVKNKMQVAKNNYAQAKGPLDEIGNQIIGVGGRIDAGITELNAIQESLAIQLQGIESILGQLQSLGSLLSSAKGRLEKGKADLTYANNRKNFPAGIPGAEAQKQAKIKANADIANASTEIVKIKGDINQKGADLKTSSDVYNQTGAYGVNVANGILADQDSLKNLKSTYDARLVPLRSAVNLRNGALNDVGEAQSKLSYKLATSTMLAQTAIGANGASQALKYMSAGQHLKATGAGVNAGIEIGSGYIPDLNPYVPLLKTAVSVGFDTLQNGGDVRYLAENLGEAFVGYKSSQRIFNSIDGALTIMPQDPYTAFQIIAVETHEGVEVLGKITTFASPFMGAIAVTPFIPILIPVGQSLASGGISTMVEAGKKIANDEFLGAELGTGRPSGVSVILGGLFASAFYGPSAKVANAINKMFSDGGTPTNENTALAIQRMAMTGAQKAPIPNYRIEIRMNRITYPTTPNFSGEVLP